MALIVAIGSGVFPCILFPKIVYSQSANVQFFSAVNGICQVTLIQSGTLVVSSDGKTLSSNDAQSGLAELKCTSNKDVRIDLYAPQQLSGGTLTNPVLSSKLEISDCKPGDTLGNPILAGNSSSGYNNPAQSNSFGWNGGVVRKCDTLTVNMTATNGNNLMIPAASNYSFTVGISVVEN